MGKEPGPQRYEVKESRGSDEVKARTVRKHAEYGRIDLQLFLGMRCATLSTKAPIVAPTPNSIIVLLRDDGREPKLPSSTRDHVQPEEAQWPMEQPSAAAPVYVASPEPSDEEAKRTGG